MNLVYIHIGNIDISYNNIQYYPKDTAYTYTNTPEYLWHSIKQSRRFYKDKIYVILPEQDIKTYTLSAKIYNCELIPFESFLNGENTTTLTGGHSDGASYTKEFLKAWLNAGQINNHFICVTFLRLLVLCELIRNYQLTKVWHLENDNLIFDNFPDLDKEIYCANVSDAEASAGIFFIPEPYYAQQLALDLIEYFKANPDKSEMRILKLLIKDKNYIKYFKEDKYIFDGASFGQYIAGSNQGHGPGHISEHHYFAKLIKQPSTQIKVIERKPYLIKYEAQKPIFNLHIHNKSQIRYIVNKEIENIAIGLMTAPSLEERYTACWNTWLQNFKHKFVFRGNTKKLSIPSIQLDCSDDYLSAIEKQFCGLKHIYENCKTDWFIFAGCDTYIYSDRLKQVLSNFNPEEPLYLGSKLHSGNFKALYNLPTPCEYFVSGGPGLILSKALLKQIYPILSDCPKIWKEALINFNTSTHPAAADVALAYILWKYANTFVTFIDSREYELYHCNPKDYKETARCPLAFHYVSPNLMIKLYTNETY
jgi:hypothetical protein